MKMKNSKSGFTLIEMITVLAIIILIASLVMAAGQAARRKAYEAKAKAAIASLEVALGMYQVDVGSYPADNGAPYTSNSTLVTQLDSGGGTPPTGWSGPYMQFDSKDLSGSNFIDPWSHNYYYKNPGLNHGTGMNHTSYVDIYSAGQNGSYQSSGAGQPPQGDDIANW